MALLLGPDGAREVLARRGGLVVHDDGSVEAIGPVAARLKPAAEPAGAVTLG